MLAVKSVNVRDNFKEWCDKINMGETVVISRPRNENIYMISEAEYNALQKAKKNAEYLAKNVLHLPTGEVKMLLEDVNWHYLYRYQDAVAVLSKDYKNFMVCDAEHGLITTYPCYEGEIVGCLEDGSVIFSHENQIMKADGFGYKSD